MNPYIEKLKQHSVDNPPNFGDTDSVLGLLYERNRNNTMKRCHPYGRHRFYQGILLVSFVLLAHT